MTRSTNVTRLKRTALAIVLTSVIGAAAAQSTTGSLFGNAPSAAGATITVQNESGLKRSVPVDANGRYNLGSLPVGKYSISLERDGQVLDKRENVLLRVGAGTEVSFGGEGATTLDAVTVTAANIPCRHPFPCVLTDRRVTRRPGVRRPCRPGVKRWQRDQHDSIADCRPRIARIRVPVHSLLTRPVRVSACAAESFSSSCLLA